MARRKRRRSYRSRRSPRRSYRRSSRRSRRTAGRVIRAKKSLAKRHGGAKWVCDRNGKRRYFRTKAGAKRACGK